jgi:hypothetical protein
MTQVLNASYTEHMPISYPIYGCGEYIFMCCTAVIHCELYIILLRTNSF